MIDRGVIKGVVLVATALFFGLQSGSLQLGSAVQPGPGLFPLVISIMLGMAGLAITGIAISGPREPLSAEFRNVSIVVVALVAFGLLSRSVNMVAGIVCLVAVSTLAGPKVSLLRKAAIACALLLIAYCLWKVLGLQLPLY